jgi:hypothetical protein
MTIQAAEPRSYEIEGQTVTMPLVVQHADAAVATFLVNASKARGLLPGPELDVVELIPGRALLTISCIDYIENDLGRYNEISLSFFVRERGQAPAIPYVGSLADLVRGRLPTYIYRLPVTTTLSLEAGCQIWGFPKVLHDIRFRTKGDRYQCAWDADGKKVFRFSVQKGGRRTMPETELKTYSYIDGALHSTRFVQSVDELGTRLGGARIELGDHPIADELRDLGLPKGAIMSMWIGRMHGAFDGPEKV